MKVTLIVSAITVAALGMLYIIAQPSDTLASPTEHSLSKTNQIHRGNSDL